jgi:hypothetical protein
MPGDDPSGRYERAYGTDWDSLDRDAAVERAYALGVAASLGEYHPAELDAVRAEVDTVYDRSVVDLAFDEGKNEGRSVDSADGDPAVWRELVAGETVTVDATDDPTGGRTGLPEALDRIEALALPDRNSTDALRPPDFLERD